MRDLHDYVTVEAEREQNPAEHHHPKGSHGGSAVWGDREQQSASRVNDDCSFQQKLELEHNPNCYEEVSRILATS